MTPPQYKVGERVMVAGKVGFIQFVGEIY